MVVINRSGNTINISETRGSVPFDGKPYIIPDNIASLKKYRQFIEVIDNSKDIEISRLKLEVQKNLDKVRNCDGIVKAFELTRKKSTKKLKLIYPFHFDADNINQAASRLLTSIESLSGQSADIFVINTSQHPIVINKFDVSVINHPVKTKKYCKPATINLGVKECVSKDDEYFLLSDIDLVYPPTFIDTIQRIANNCVAPSRILFFNKNVGSFQFDDGDVYKKSVEAFKTNVDNLRSREGIAPGNGLIHRESFEIIGGYDERYAGYGPEDADFNFRISKINRYEEINSDLINTYHIFHGSSLCDKKETCNNNRLYWKVKNCGLDGVIKPGDIKLSEKEMLINDEHVEEIPLC